MLFDDDGNCVPITRYNSKIKQAWQLYCEETQHDFHAVDFWEELPKHVQKYYLTLVDKQSSQ